MNLERFFKPQTVATFGGSWAVNVVEQLIKSGFSGEIWPVHPSRSEICGISCYSDIASLPAAPDASFVGVNRELTINVIEQLSRVNAGGAICFASGFKESDQGHLQDQLIEAAGAMPILGPNCYGFVNYLDNICLWPDQHGGKPVSSGVAIIAQSSNISINMSMQQRGLSVAYLFTLGNQAKIGVSSIIEEMVANTNVNAIGLYLEGIDDISGFQSAALIAHKAAKPIVALKIGKSEKAQIATISHTASLAGDAAASSALLSRLGIIEVDSISVFLETLKLLNEVGPLAGPRISSISCSGGEASLMSDLAFGTEIDFPDFTSSQLERLADVLGPRVELANPLDYHTYIWGDESAMTACFESVASSGFDLNVFVLDLPREDLCDTAGHECAVQSIIAAKQKTGANVAVIGLLAENLNEKLSERFIAAGVVPLHDMKIGLAAIDAAIRAGRLRQRKQNTQALLTRDTQDVTDTQVINEQQAKSTLAEYGLLVPRSQKFDNKTELGSVSAQLQFPVVLKGLGVAHKTEVGAVILNIESPAALEHAFAAMPDCAQGYLLEEMTQDVIAEILLGVSFDATGLCLLTIGAGGILTELLADTAHVLLPCDRDEIERAIQSLKLAKILNGYRGKPPANISSLVDAVQSVCDYVEQTPELLELDINPLMVGTHQSVAVDALIRLRC